MIDEVTLPDTIQARMHESTISRVTRMYASTLDEIFNETLQNARRAGATAVNVKLEATSREWIRITMRDNGQGIEDPQKLLSYGENGWDGDLIEREDAAGMGLLSLARYGCKVHSCTRQSKPWKVTIDTEHFLGKKSAAVEPSEEQAPGTQISFEITNDPCHMRTKMALARSAIHCPVPVHLELQIDGETEHEELEQRPFLRDAVHVEEWEGMRIGVYRTENRWVSYDEETLNFHGITIKHKLPTMCTLGNQSWKAKIDIEDCPKLELVLPARKEVVKTPFLKELNIVVQNTIFRAIAEHGEDRLAYEDWIEAQANGIQIKIPEPRLRRWKSTIADSDNKKMSLEFADVDDQTLVMEHDPEPSEGIVIERAIEKAGQQQRFVESKKDLQGYHWYNELRRVTEFQMLVGTIDVLQDVIRYPIPEVSASISGELPERPEEARVELTVQDENENRETIKLDTDMMFVGEAWCSIYEAMPLVTKSSKLEPWELADMLTEGFFSPSDDVNADSWEVQKQWFEDEAIHLANRILRSEDEAIKRSIHEMFRREVAHLVPKGRNLIVSYVNNNVQVDLKPAA